MPDIKHTAQLHDLIDRAEAGDAVALDAVRCYFDANPALWQEIGDLSRVVELRLTEVAAEGSVVAHEALGRKVQELRDELAGADPTPLEKILVQRLVVTWLQCYQADLVAMRVEARPPAQAEFYGKQQQRAHQRFLASVKTLATVRKLLRVTPSPVQFAAQLQGHDRGRVAPRGHRFPAPAAVGAN